MSSLSQRMRSYIKGRMLRYVPGMITCAEFEEFILSYLEGSLGQTERRRFEWHIRLCRECREYLASYKRTIELEKAAFADADAPVPDDVPEELVQAILEAKRR